MKKYFVYFNDCKPEEFTNIDEANEYYGSLYLMADKIKITDELGNILAQKAKN